MDWQKIIHEKLDRFSKENTELRERIQTLENIVKHLRNKFIAISGNTDPIAVNHIVKLVDDILNKKD